MSDVTQILDAITGGDLQAASQLLPLVYDELRRLAAQQLAREAPGQTLDATGLVHEAYLRLVGPADERRWKDRGQDSPVQSCHQNRKTPSCGQGLGQLVW